MIRTPRFFDNSGDADTISQLFENLQDTLTFLNEWHHPLDPQDATMKINAWRQDYNQVRTHGSIDNRVPMDLLKPTHQPWLMGPNDRISDFLSGPSPGSGPNHSGSNSESGTTRGGRSASALTYR